MKSYKIVNDPVHGFITIPEGTISLLVEHRWFQRLRYIKQLGLTHLVYPGATHSRFLHALGAMHLMREAIATLRLKGVAITAEEEVAAAAAMVLHDIGHGPFSHTLEGGIVIGVSHEELSLQMMRALNRELGGELEEAIAIFNGEHPKKFLHQLVSGQLDSDRLDYLARDSFFSGVAEGMIGLERIIKMLTVADGKLVVEEKGLHSIEKFLLSRRLMYWQVYLHKTVVAAEQLLLAIFKRARDLLAEGYPLAVVESLHYFLSSSIEKGELGSVELLERFTKLDDSLLLSTVKGWIECDDFTLSLLCRMLIERRLPKIELLDSAPTKEQFEEEERLFLEKVSWASKVESSYFITSGEILNSSYDSEDEEILIVSKGGELLPIDQLSDLLSASAFLKVTKKGFICRVNRDIKV